MRIIANGLHTDHPIPGLPFVDDSLIDPNDKAQIEAIGRRNRQGNRNTWGREDSNGPSQEPIWRAFTTIPDHPEYAWAVRRHKIHGVSIILIADDDAAIFHNRHENALTFRHGGYWTPDGNTWYRPFSQIDPLGLEPRNIAVPDGTTVYADDILDDLGNSTLGRNSLYTVEEIATAEEGGRDVAIDSFVDWVRTHLATWRDHRKPNDRNPSACIVDLRAPELDASRLVAVPAVASALGISQGTLRGYVSRGQGIEPQFTNPTQWSLPVVDHWAASRNREGRIEAPPFSEETNEQLIEIAENISNIVGPHLDRKGKIKDRDRESVASTTARILRGNIIGLSHGDEMYPGYIYGAWLIREWEKNRERYERRGLSVLSDNGVDRLCSLMHLNPMAAQTAITELAKYLVEEGRTREEALSILTAHPLLMNNAYEQFIAHAISPQTPTRGDGARTRRSTRDEKYRAMCDQIAATVAEFSDESTTPDQALKAYAGMTLQVDTETLPRLERLEHQMRQEILMAALAGTVTNAQVGNVRDRILNNVESSPHT